MPAHGALNFLFNPDLDAAAAPALWRTDANPSVLVVGQHPQGIAKACPGQSGRMIIARDGDLDAVNLVLEDASGRYRVRMVPTTCSELMGCVVRSDEDLELRIAALRAYQQSGRIVPRPRQSRLLRPTRYQRFRLSLLLSILDRLRDTQRRPPSTREIARDLVYPGMQEMSALDWKTSSQRRQVQRLVVEARRMSASGFRDLLHGSSQARHRAGGQAGIEPMDVDPNN